MRVPVCPLLLLALVSSSPPTLAVEVSTDYWHWYSAGLWNLNGASDRIDHVIHYEGQTYFAGNFQRAGLQTIFNVAAWDGGGWQMKPYPTFVSPFATYAGDLITRQVRWDGTTATEMVHHTVFLPTTFYGDDTRLAAAGYSAAAGGALVVSVWNEAWQQYEDIPGAFTNSVTTGDPTIHALLPWQGGWIAAGRDFYEVGGLPVNHVAYWDGSQWHDWSRPTYCYSLAEYQGSVYVGDRQGVHRRDGSAWTTVASITSGGAVPAIRALHVDGNLLYAGGQFNTIGPLNTQNISRFDGSSWQSMGGGIQGPYVATLTTDGTRVYAGGVFSGASGVNARNAAFWDGTKWNRMGPAGLELVDSDFNPVAPRTWALHDDDVFAGGDFEAWGVQELNGIGRLIGGRWASLSSGFDGPVNDLVSYGGLLVAVGEFTHAGTSPQPGVSRRAGSNWYPMTSCMNGTVQAALVLDGDLYIGGNFYEIDGQTMSHVARYDGAAWTRVGGHVFPSVMSLGSTQGDLVIGGSFVIVEGQPMLYVARWDGAQWNPMGSGLPTPVLTVAEIDGVLYAGGNFGVRVWNGSAWTTPGGGLNGAVRDFASWGGRVVVAGDFSEAGGLEQAGIASWDPVTQAWVDPGFSLRRGSQSPGTGRALLSAGNKLYVSGTFDYVDRTDGSSVAVANVAGITDPATVSAPASPIASGPWIETTPNPFNPRTVIDYGVERAGTVTVAIFDLRGRRIATLVDEPLEAGSHRTSWDGRDDARRPVASGMYLVRVATGSGASTRKVVLTK